MSPDAADVAMYAELLDCDAPGVDTSVLLLGNTPALFPLCTAALDIDPFIDDPRVSMGDWRDNTTTFDAMVGDGVVNLDESLAHAIVDMAARYSRRLVVRSFTRRLPPMRIATFFPAPSDFRIVPNTIRESDEGYAFYRWDFTSPQ
jgi:hypothetical protein